MHSSDEDKWLGNGVLSASAAAKDSEAAPFQAGDVAFDPEGVWAGLLHQLEAELPHQQFATWLRPLTVDPEQAGVVLLAPNRFIRDWVEEKFLSRINELLGATGASALASVAVQGHTPAIKPLAAVHGGPRDAQDPQDPRVNARRTQTELWEDSGAGINDEEHVVAAYRQEPPITRSEPSPQEMWGRQDNRRKVDGGLKHEHALLNNLNFGSFIEGKSNQLARAAALQVAENPGGSYNPLFIYGATGLGKTHLMHSVGNALLDVNRNAKIVYLHSERFVADMVKALQLNAINDFKRYYRSVDALLIDDIQFFANKDRSQEEFFHTFNALLEGGQQMILTCDRYPKEIKGLEERLKSRFGWGLTVAIDPPELETRAAILMKKAEQSRIELPNDVAMFIAQRVRSNVRDLEGALKRVMASANFHGRPIDEDLVRESLKDLFAMQDRQVSLDNIQRTVAEYYKIKVSDLMSKRRSRSVARPRQLAMALAKELTNHSLPEIGNGFGGKDHTTVLHACRKIAELRESDIDVGEDYKNVLRTLTS